MGGAVRIRDYVSTSQALSHQSTLRRRHARARTRPHQARREAFHPAPDEVVLAREADQAPVVAPAQMPVARWGGAGAAAMGRGVRAAAAAAAASPPPPPAPPRDAHFQRPVLLRRATRQRPVMMPGRDADSGAVVGALRVMRLLAALALRPLEALLVPAADLVDVRPGLWEDACELHEPVADARHELDVDARRRDSLSASPAASSPAASAGACGAGSLLRAPQPPRHDNRVVDQGVALAREEVGGREAGEQGVGRAHGREQVFGRKVGPPVRADVQDDHGAHHLGREHAVGDVGDQRGRRDARAQDRGGRGSGGGGGRCWRGGAGRFAAAVVAVVVVVVVVVRVVRRLWGEPAKGRVHAVQDGAVGGAAAAVAHERHLLVRHPVANVHVEGRVDQDQAGGRRQRRLAVAVTARGGTAAASAAGL